MPFDTPFRSRSEPAPTPHATLVRNMMFDTDLLMRIAELDEAGGFLIDARRTAFQTKRAADEAKAQQEHDEAELLLSGGIEGKNEQERKAYLLRASRTHPDYPQWQRIRQDAAQAQLDAEAAQVRFEVAKAELRAAAAAVSALGSGS